VIFSSKKKGSVCRDEGIFSTGFKKCPGIHCVGYLTFCSKNGFFGWDFLEENCSRDFKCDLI